MNMNDKSTYKGILYACASGRQKKRAREKLIMDLLYETEESDVRYLKFQDINKLDKCDKETEEYYIYRFGYLYQIPKTEIDLYVCKNDNLLFLKKDNIGWGFNEVEKEVYRFIEEQIKQKNLYIRTNINCEEFLIK